MNKEIKELIKRINNNYNKYNTKEELIEDLITLKEIILIDNNKYFNDKPKMKSLYN